ncbi:LysM peptidoglycan-binding domain-containing protein [Aspergillus brunneoviolaceus CBS 621.78]|uniref:Uncharacterized protein n=1 Tax=Aspergillus brunneoviolaceus CBS 621.78 TaxID=1450534 RepID=A0ACD1GE04_9EURO|nr:hypothetical protein BO95DRAFT_451911 [Aspergillus brunneoviolaceus CBS 621.78]RAH47432.1 hypothetical protein BO95DRAFT_451911 [Aspergillus brunneoviolaceus CBS 621.78]
MRGRWAISLLAASCFDTGQATHYNSHAYLHAAVHHSVRRIADSDPTTGEVSMFQNGSLASLGLTTTCEEALYQSVACDPAISSLTSDDYLGSFDNATLTALVCASSCEKSIKQLQSSVLTGCGDEAGLIPGLPFVGLVDMLWANWNQSCFMDPTTGENCNDQIASFDNVTSLSDISNSDLCSYCYVKKLALMQANGYSGVYNDDWQSTYEYVAKTCNLQVADFDPTPSVFNVSLPSEQPNCVSGSFYTSQEGDSCDSIALSHNVSAATMYYTNSNLLNCTDPNDTCTSIAIENFVGTQNIVAWNSQLNSNCSNLHSGDPFWGSMLCVSPPGGTYTGQPLSNGSTSTEAEAVNPPFGVTVAPGTTTDCAGWYTHDLNSNLTCTEICLSNQISIHMFIAANPSLNQSTCDTNLTVGDAYCIDPLTGFTTTNATGTATNSSTSTLPSTAPAPTQTGIVSSSAAYGITEVEFFAWNPAVPSDCESGFWTEEAYCVGVSGSTVSTTASTSATSIAAPAPTQTGIPGNCNAYHVAQELTCVLFVLVPAGDTCASVAAAYGITEAQFFAWNPAVASDCESGFWTEEAYCVSVA